MKALVAQRVGGSGQYIKVDPPSRPRRFIPIQVCSFPLPRFYPERNKKRKGKRAFLFLWKQRLGAKCWVMKRHSRRFPRRPIASAVSGWKPLTRLYPADHQHVLASISFYHDISSWENGVPLKIVACHALKLNCRKKWRKMSGLFYSKMDQDILWVMRVR